MLIPTLWLPSRPYSILQCLSNTQPLTLYIDLFIAHSQSISHSHPLAFFTTIQHIAMSVQHAATHGHLSDQPIQKSTKHRQCVGPQRLVSGKWCSLPYSESIFLTLSNSSSSSSSFSPPTLSPPPPSIITGQLATVYARLLKDMWSDRYTKVVPREFKRTIGEFRPQVRAIHNGMSYHIHTSSLV